MQMHGHELHLPLHLDAYLHCVYPGSEVHGSRGRAAVARRTGGGGQEAEMTRASVQQRVVPPVGSLRARAMVRG